MKTARIFAALALLAGLAAAADCHGDNCANHVTGTFAGIGVPISKRVALCNDFLRTTVRPPPRTVTTTFTKFVAHPGKSETTSTPTRSTSSSATSTTTDKAVTTTNSTTDPPGPTAANALSTPSSLQTITHSAIPTFAASECPGDGQFASACRCWSRVTPRVTTLRPSTVTVTSTVSVNVACSPAATAVTNTTRFPCSNGFGMCSCLRTGESSGTGTDDSGVCVRVGSGFWDDPSSASDGNPGDDPGRAAFDDGGQASADADADEEDRAAAHWNVTGPCFFARECGADFGCTSKGLGNVCVFDNSCLCGTRRCYQAVAGCGGMEVPPLHVKEEAVNPS